MEPGPEDKTKAEPSRPDEQWRTRVAADLAAYRAGQERLWGGIDELTLARYEAGVSPDAERARVERALLDHPALRECLEIARELSTGQGSPLVEDVRRGQRGGQPWVDHADRSDPDPDPGQSR